MPAVDLVLVCSRSDETASAMGCGPATLATVFDGRNPATAQVGETHLARADCGDDQGFAGQTFPNTG
jgi:hypothetical protein